MRRAATAIVCLAAVWLVAIPASAGDSLSRVQVTGTEYNLTLSHHRTNPGDTIIEFVNSGEDAHDMKIQREGGAEHAFGVIQAGGDPVDLEMHLKRGATYELWCSLETPVNHRENGMASTLQVRKHRRK